MYNFVLSIHVIVCILLIFVILIQQKGGGLSSVFGGGESVFGGRGSNPFLTKTTTILFALFLIISLNLVVLTKGKQTPRESAIERAIKKGEVEEIVPPVLPHEGE